MEAFGATGSCITLLGLALQSSKCIYETISNIRNGPAITRALAKGLGDLEQVLEKLVQLAERAQQTRSVTDGKLLEEITPSIKKCVEDLGATRSKLNRLRRDIGIQNAGSLQILHDAIAEAFHDISKRGCNIEELLINHSVQAQSGLKELLDSVNEESLVATTAAALQIGGINQLRRSINSMRMDSKNAFISTSRRSKAHSSDLEALVRMMQHVQLDVQALRQNASKGPKVSCSDTQHPQYIQVETDGFCDREIERSLARLSDLACAGKRILYSSSAQRVADDICTLLRRVMEETTAVNYDRHEFAYQQRKSCEQSSTKEESIIACKDGRLKLQNILKRSDRLIIQGQNCSEVEYNGLRYNVRSLWDSIRKEPGGQLQNSNGAWSLQTSHASWYCLSGKVHVSLRLALLFSNQATQQLDHVQEMFTAKAEITPVNGAHPRSQIILDLAEKTLANCTTSLTPVLGVRNMVPDGAEIFQIVSHRSIKELQEFLSTGAASLRDCDIMGRSLLHVTVEALLNLGQPFVCLDSTQDANMIETIPLLLLANLYSQGTAKLYQIPDKIALFLSRGANVHLRNTERNTCAHIALSHHGDRFDPRWQDAAHLKDIIRLMITAGADICAVNHDGLSVSDVAFRFGHQEIWREALRYCGIDLRDVLAKRTVEEGCSSAVDAQYGGAHGALRSKVTLADYLQRRKVLNPEEDRGETEYVNGSEEDEDWETEDELKAKEEVALNLKPKSKIE
ncbi:MAG: hypothetical protein Q9163_000986 [Psora crenata]